MGPSTSYNVAHPACGLKGSTHLSPWFTPTSFYRDAGSALLQLVNKWLNFSSSRPHVLTLSATEIRSKIHSCWNSKSQFPTSWAYVVLTRSLTLGIRCTKENYWNTHICRNIVRVYPHLSFSRLHFFSVTQSVCKLYAFSGSKWFTWHIFKTGKSQKPLQENHARERKLETTKITHRTSDIW